MKEITKNEMEIILSILKNPSVSYNASNMAKKIGISSMGALKIVKRLENENILNSKQFGKSIFYNLNFKNEYLIEYLRFLLNKEAEQSNSYIKRWVKELKKIKSSEIMIIFGSILKKGAGAKDVDVLFVVNQKKSKSLISEIEKINELNDKKIHPIYQLPNDFKSNIDKLNKIILGAIEGVVVKGQGKFINFLKEVYGKIK